MRGQANHSRRGLSGLGWASVRADDDDSLVAEVAGTATKNVAG
jgi:hypothetical protein